MLSTLHIHIYNSIYNMCMRACASHMEGIHMLHNIAIQDVQRRAYAYGNLNLGIRFSRFSSISILFSRSIIKDVTFTSIDASMNRESLYFNLHSCKDSHFSSDKSASLYRESFCTYNRILIYSKLRVVIAVYL